MYHFSYFKLTWDSECLFLSILSNPFHLVIIYICTSIYPYLSFYAHFLQVLVVHEQQFISPFANNRKQTSVPEAFYSFFRVWQMEESVEHSILLGENLKWMPPVCLKSQWDLALRSPHHQSSALLTSLEYPPGTVNTLSQVCSPNYVSAFHSLSR